MEEKEVAPGLIHDRGVERFLLEGFAGVDGGRFDEGRRDDGRCGGFYRNLNLRLNLCSGI
jgi:hypothetical protein